MRDVLSSHARPARAIPPAHAIVAVLCLALTLAPAAPARAVSRARAAVAPVAPPPKPTPAVAAARSVQYYDQSRFDEAIGLLRDLVEHQSLDDRSRARALEILARCYAKKGYPVLAKDMFKELLAINPGYRPDPIQVPPDEAALFDRARKEFLAEPEGSRRTAALAARGPDATTSTEPMLAPSAGRLEMRVQPYASFYVDDTLRATNVQTARMDLAAGEHRVRVVHPAFEPKEWTVRLPSGRVTRLDYDFPAVSAGMVRVSSGDVWAEVYLDGRNTGRTTPCVLEGLSYGNHTVSVARAGFDVSGGPQVVPVRPGETAHASFRLHPNR
jgi:hypothetical protein